MLINKISFAIKNFKSLIFSHLQKKHIYPKWQLSNSTNSTFGTNSTKKTNSTNSTLFVYIIIFCVLFALQKIA